MNASQAAAGSASGMTQSAGKSGKTMLMGQKSVGIGCLSDYGQPDGSAGRLTHSAGKASKTMPMGQKSVGIGGRAIMGSQSDQRRL